MMLPLCHRKAGSSRERVRNKRLTIQKRNQKNAAAVVRQRGETIQMIYYVNAAASFQGDGSENRPFRHIQDAASVAKPGDEVVVAPGVYREYVDPKNAGRPDARIIYRARKSSVQ